MFLILCGSCKLIGKPVYQQKICQHCFLFKLKANHEKNTLVKLLLTFSTMKKNSDQQNLKMEYFLGVELF